MNQQHCSVNITKYWFGLLVLTVLLAACKTGPTAVSKKKASGSTLSEKNRMSFQYLFYNANKEKILSNYEAAIGLFQQAIAIDPASDASYYELARIYEKASKGKEALVCARKAVALNPDNDWYQSFLAEALLKNNFKNEAVPIYEQLAKKNPENLSYYFDWASALINTGRFNDAIKVYDKLEAKIGIKPEVSLQKERLYLKLNKVDKAVAELLKLIEEFPKEVQYYGILAELYQANNLPDKALETFKKIEELDPSNVTVHLSLANFYRSIGKKDKTFEELKLAFSNKNLEVETAISILSSYFLMVEKYPEFKDQALTLNKLLIEKHPSEARGYAIYGDFFYMNKQLDSARTQYRKAIQLDKEKFAVWQQLMMLESEMADHAALLKETEEGLGLFPNQPLVYLFNGIAKIQLKQFHEAITVLRSGIKQVIENKPLLAQFYAQIGDAYYKLNKHKESDIAFDKALEEDNKNSYVLNNYSYYLSLRGDSLPKAEKMSLICNTLEPNNSSFQDTYAWILYKEGKFEEAKTWMEKAIKNGGEKSAVILEHYGDILFKMNDKEKALEYWSNAKLLGQGSEFLDKKITDKKLYE
jgi:tetratricopeptide (TPR) repeat protein